MNSHNNAAALVKLAFDIDEPRECIQAIRRLFTLGGGPKQKTDTWAPTPEQVKAWAALDASKAEALEDPRMQLAAALSFRHQAESRDSATCAFCYVPPEVKRIDHSQPTSEHEDSRAIEVVATEAPIAPLDELCMGCHHPKSHHVSASMECLNPECARGLHQCTLFAVIDEAERRQAARDQLPARIPRW
jgi:hypothetical protein